MKEILIQATKRDTTGKKSKLRELRSADRIPAVLYGKSTDATSISMDRKTFELAYRDNLRHARYVIEVEGTPRQTLIKDVQKNKLTERIEHVDFFAFDANHKTEYMVPIVTLGTAVGEKTGGILTVVQREVKVRAMPLDIPDKIEIDVTNLDLNHTIRIRDLHTEKFEFIAHPEDPVVSVVSPRGIEEATVAAPAEGAEAAAPADGKAAAPAAKDAKKK